MLDSQDTAIVTLMLYQAGWVKCSLRKIFDDQTRALQRDSPKQGQTDS
jgi:hypothetical protein